MKSIRKIKLQTSKKTNSELVETINEAKKNKNWLKIAHFLSTPRRNRLEINLKKIDEIAKNGEKIAIPGKILSVGELNKKVNISAFKISEGAKKKLKEKKIEFNSILDEIKTNPSAKGVRILP